MANLTRLTVLLALIGLVQPALAQNTNPRAGNTFTVTTGGVAVTVLTKVHQGCYVTNPVTATDQGISAAEDLYIDPSGIAATTTANDTVTALSPGQSFSCIPSSGFTISANAVSSGHKFTVIQW